LSSAHRTTLPELLEARFEQMEKALAVVGEADAAFGVSSFTYAQLNDKVNCVAHRLRAEGVRPGDVVGVLTERSFAMIVGILGILKAGGAYLPLAPAYPPDRLDYMLQDSGAKVLLRHPRTAGRVAFAGCSLDLEDPALYAGPAGNPTLVNTPDDLAYIIYTSGSTGKPKGVMIEQHSVVNRLQWMQRAYPLDQGDVILQKTPYAFDVSVWELLWWALEGARLCLLPPGAESNPLAIMSAVRRERVSVMHFVPSMLSVFLEYLEGKNAGVLAGLAPLRNVFASGEALTPSHVAKFNAVLGAATGARLINLYGPTEATVDVSYFDCPRSGDLERVPIGRAIDNMTLYVLKDGRQAAPGEPGELCIAGVGLARGYVNNAALTAEKFTDNPVKPGERIYRTGDVARWLPDGNVEYLGREDHQVKIRGMRIELGEIENTIRSRPGVTDCVAVVDKLSEQVAQIAAYVVSRSELDVEGLRGYLRTQLPDHMVPHRFERIEQMPLTPNGKADRRALLSRAHPEARHAQ
jgi:amino acid adenylation domain-containing protein